MYLLAFLYKTQTIYIAQRFFMPILDWLGKSAVTNHHNQVPCRLVHCNGSLSSGNKDSGNLL